MSEFTNEKVLLRVYISENDKYRRKPLFKALIDLFNSEGYAVATVLKGVAGFGGLIVHRDDASAECARRLPLIVEVISCLERIEEIIPKISRMMNDGMITMRKVAVAHYCTNISRQEKLKELKKMAH